MNTRFLILFPLALLGGFGAPAFGQDEPIPEIAPLERFRPAIIPFAFSYEANELMFSPHDAERLKSLAMRLRGTKDKVLLTSYAGNAQMSPQEAVKLSYKRAMLVRNYLLRLGVDGKQVDVDALGAPTHGEPTDRVSLHPITTP